MVLPDPRRHQRRLAPTCSHPEDQPRPAGERHPQQTHPLPLRTRPRLPHAPTQAVWPSPSTTCCCSTASSASSCGASPKQRAGGRRLGGTGGLRAFVAHTVARPAGLPSRLLGLGLLSGRCCSTPSSCLPPASGCATPGLARRRGAQGARSSFAAVSLRPRPPAARKEPEPVGAGCAFDRGRGATLGHPSGRLSWPTGAFAGPPGS